MLISELKEMIKGVFSEMNDEELWNAYFDLCLTIKRVAKEHNLEVDPFDILSKMNFNK